MTVKLSSLRVSAELDASAYVAGANAKEAADKRIVESSKAVAQALAAQDAQAAKLGSAFSPCRASSSKATRRRRSSSRLCATSATPWIGDSAPIGPR